MNGYETNNKDLMVSKTKNVTEVNRFEITNNEIPTKIIRVIFFIS